MNIDRQQQDGEKPATPKPWRRRVNCDWLRRFIVNPERFRGQLSTRFRLSTLQPSLKLRLGRQLSALSSQLSTRRVSAALLLAVAAILFASNFRAAPNQSQPDIPFRFGAPQASPAPITVSLPIDSLDVSVPFPTVFIKPVTTTNIDSILNYVGFQ